MKYNIDYYFVRGDLKNNLDILQFDKRVDDISIYRVIDPPSSHS